jgi:hypothetical protein
VVMGYDTSLGLPDVWKKMMVVEGSMLYRSVGEQTSHRRGNLIK